MPSCLEAATAAASACAVGDSRSQARLVAAEDEREHPLRRMLAEREAQPGAPRGAEEMRTLDAERVEDCDSVPDTRRQRVGARLAWLVAAALTAMIGEDRPELAAQGSGQARPFATSSGSAKPV